MSISQVVTFQPLAKGLCAEIAALAKASSDETRGGVQVTYPEIPDTILDSIITVGAAGAKLCTVREALTGVSASVRAQNYGRAKQLQAHPEWLAEGVVAPSGTSKTAKVAAETF